MGPDHIAYALREIRASQRLQNTPALVRAERFAQAFELTSVFAKSRAAEILGFDRRTLHRKLDEYRAADPTIAF